MSRRMTIQEILPLIADLTLPERVRLVRLTVEQPGVDEAEVYRILPSGRSEFSSGEDLLEWEADGWEDLD